MTGMMDSDATNIYKHLLIPLLRGSQLPPPWVVLFQELEPAGRGGTQAGDHLPQDSGLCGWKTPQCCVFLAGKSTYEPWVFPYEGLKPMRNHEFVRQIHCLWGRQGPSIFSQLHGCYASRLEDWDDWGQGKAGCGIVWGPSFLATTIRSYWPMDPIGYTIGF